MQVHSLFPASHQRKRRRQGGLGSRPENSWRRLLRLARRRGPAVAEAVPAQAGPGCHFLGFRPLHSSSSTPTINFIPLGGWQGSPMETVCRERDLPWKQPLLWSLRQPLCRGEAPAPWKRQFSTGAPLPRPPSFGELCLGVRDSLPSLRGGSHSVSRLSISGPFCPGSPLGRAPLSVPLSEQGGCFIIKTVLS